MNVSLSFLDAIKMSCNSTIITLAPGIEVIVGYDNYINVSYMIISIAFVLTVLMIMYLISTSDDSEIHYILDDI